MLRHLYSILWYPALPFALAAAGARDARDRRERMGRIELPPGASPPRIWIHAASVGEIEAVRPIAAGLRRRYEHGAIVVTTMTATGRDAARRRIAGAAACALAPLDCPLTVRAFLRAVRPNLVLVAETELWPNYFIESRRAGARVAVINGRISERALAGYRRAKSLFAAALQCADLILVQSADDARRYFALGAPPDRVIVTGNTKFDLVLDGTGPPLREELEQFASGRPVLVAGSTAPGEEAVVADAYLKLRERFPALALVIAPRHPARTPEVEQVVRARALAYVRASELPPPAPDVGAERAPLLILDTMGELRALYGRAAIAFVGGSLDASRGGQNVAEPAAASVPVLFGPHYENQREMASALISAGGAQVVRDAGEIADACARWLTDDRARQSAGQAARQTAGEAGGGARRTLMHLESLAVPVES
ncbi:MAG TPA: 3-deoxy-D-manno-octulosonic acid transferase [Candidatus Binataceae bacterium]|nr:3-deoxy-D-manno-octulosonic acid transferase [Candidatus Binataceae bacterium]